MSVPIFKSPEIDGVRRSLEYANDGHGDVLSDMYWQMLDDVTAQI